MENTPVLLLVFNRPDLTKALLDVIKTVRPKRLYIVADGPRGHIPGELEACRKVREVFDAINWDCEVRKLFRDDNMGCDPSIMDGISWFFSQEEQGIILEDDCIPALSFFEFSQQMLNEYKHRKDIALVCGSNFCNKPLSGKYDYFIGSFMNTWGWATWKHVWDGIDWNKRYAPEAIEAKLSDVFKDKEYTQHLCNNINNAYKQDVPHWDAIFFLHNIFNDRKGIIPAFNQITNKGNTGTHYNNSQSELLNLNIFELKKPSNGQYKGMELSSKDLKKLTKNYVNKVIKLTLRDKLYLLKVKIKRAIYGKHPV